MVDLQVWYTTSVQYLRDVRSELYKVTFPSRKETIASTIVVLVAVGIISMYLGIVDFMLGRILHSILR
jgi:preprotein translocase subunit SecE